MTKGPFKELLSGYVNNTLTREELVCFLKLIQQEEHAEEFKVQINRLLSKQALAGGVNQDKADVIFKNIIDAGRTREKAHKGNLLKLNHHSKRSAFLKIAAAASIIGLIVLGTYQLFNKGTNKKFAKLEIKNRNYKNNLPSGTNKAVLTLADGSTIVLDDAKNGALAQQGNTQVIKIDGKLDYNFNGSASKEVLYNTISTPRGGQYRVELPDGSMVWLNAASSLRFPTAFSGKERRVEITGEAYFEVAPLTPKGGQGKIPFTVKVNGAEVRVMGTRFDVMAYDDEAIVKTTLLEGSVKFVKNNISSMLSPGQQSQLSKDGRVKIINDIDADKVIAWKNGIFNFQGADVGAVARQLSRWYDVDVVCNKKIDDLFYAEIPRSTRLADVLKALELTGKVHFKIEGQRIVVMP